MSPEAFKRVEAAAASRRIQPFDFCPGLKFTDSATRLCAGPASVSMALRSRRQRRFKHAEADQPRCFLYAGRAETDRRFTSIERPRRSGNFAGTSWTPARIGQRHRQDGNRRWRRLASRAPPRANMICATYPREISEQRGRYDSQSSIQGNRARSQEFVRSAGIARSP